MYNTYLYKYFSCFHGYDQILQLSKNLIPSIELYNMDEKTHEVSFSPALIGRDKEFDRLQSIWEKVKRGTGHTVFISGEAGIGKTRLVSELINRVTDARIIKGWCISDAYEPLMPFREALRQAELYHLIAESAPPKVISTYLMNDSGLLITKAERQESDLDPDIFASMLTAVSNFVGDSLSMMGEEGGRELSAIGYGKYQILIQNIGNLSMATVIEGKNTEFLIDEMRKVLLGFDDSLDDWDGDMALVKEIEPKISWFIDSGKYEGKFLVEDPKLRQENLFDNVLLGLQRLSSEQPIILFLDDLQWADPTSLKLLHYITRNTRAHNMLIIGTYRPEETTINNRDSKVNNFKNTMQDMNREGLFQEIELYRLDKSSIKEFLKATLGYIEDGHVDVFYKESEGNPFFLLEIIHMLVEEEHIVKEQGKWLVKKSIEEVEISSKIQDVIARRLDRLIEEQIDLLECASVVGEEFESDVVGEVAGMNRIDVLKNLNKIEKKHRLIYSVNNRYRFDHNKIREILYKGINEELRVEFHKLIGNSYEHIYSENIDDIIEKIANHYYLGKHQEAGNYLFRAAQKLKNIYSNEESIHFYEKIFECTEDPSLNVKSLFELGQVKALLGRYNESLEIYDNILSMDIKEKEKIKSYLEISKTYQNKGDFDSAIAYSDEGLSLISDPCPELCELINIKGWSLMREGYYEEANTLFNKEMKISDRLQDDLELGQALHNLGTINWFKGDHNTAISYLKQALKIRRDSRDLKGESDTLNNLGTAHYDKGDLDGSIFYHSQSLEIESKIGNKKGIAMSLNNIGVVYKNKGELERALEYYKKSLEVRTMIGDRQGITSTLYNIGNLYLHIGNLKDAYNNLIKSQLEAERIKDKQGLVMSLEKIGEVKRLKGDLEGALDYYKRSINISKEIGFESYIVYGLCGMANVYITKGDNKRAFKKSEEALKLSRKLDSIVEKFESVLMVGRVLTKMEKLAEANDKFLEAEEIVNKIRNDGDLAAFHYGYSYLLMEKGEKDDAKKHLDKALSLFDKMGMKLWADKVEETLSAL